MSSDRTCETCRPCVECGSAPECVGGDVIYSHLRDLHGRWYWRCACGAYVGCHRGSKMPLGAPAGPETRRARNAAHKAFDPLWHRKMRRDGCGVETVIAAQDKMKAAMYALRAALTTLNEEET